MHQPAPPFAHTSGPRNAKLALVGEAGLVKLTQHMFAIVSPEDAERVSQYDWYTQYGLWATYAKSDGPGKSMYLHRFVMNAPRDAIVHHIDKDGLNCRRSNLVITSQLTNAAHAALRFNKRTSRYRGVSWHSQRGKWVAEITVNYRRRYLGLFMQEEDAAQAFNKASLELRGPGFPLNEVDP